MTLVLSEVSKLGVAMAADSAVTFGNERVYVGAQKLLPVYKINAGISIWGNGVVNNVDADVWLQNFIENYVKEDMSLWAMAELLAKKLNDAFNNKPISGRMGFHVAGFDEKNGIRGPAFYHVHNGHYHIEYKNGQVTDVPDENPSIREFRAHDDRSPMIYSQNDFYVTRNGDFSIFAFLHQTFGDSFRMINQMTGLNFPSPLNLEIRGEYLRFWIRTISEIYRLSNARNRILPQAATAGDAGIGGPVSVLTISSSGIDSFYTK